MYCYISLKKVVKDAALDKIPQLTIVRIVVVHVGENDAKFHNHIYNHPSSPSFHHTFNNGSKRKLRENEKKPWAI
jgi:hypothetical protein